MPRELREKPLDLDTLANGDLELLARRLAPLLPQHAGGTDEKRIAALEKEVHRLSKEVYKLRLEMSDQPDLDYDRR